MVTAADAYRLDESVSTPVPDDASSAEDAGPAPSAGLRSGAGKEARRSRIEHWRDGEAGTMAVGHQRRIRRVRERPRACQLDGVGRAEHARDRRRMLPATAARDLPAHTPVTEPWSTTAR